MFVFNNQMTSGQETLAGRRSLSIADLMGKATPKVDGLTVARLQRMEYSQEFRTPGFTEDEVQRIKTGEMVLREAELE